MTMVTPCALTCTSSISSSVLQPAAGSTSATSALRRTSCYSLSSCRESKLACASCVCATSTARRCSAIDRHAGGAEAGANNASTVLATSALRGGSYGGRLPSPASQCHSWLARKPGPLSLSYGQLLVVLELLLAVLLVLRALRVLRVLRVRRVLRVLRVLVMLLVLLILRVSVLLGSALAGQLPMLCKKKWSMASAMRRQLCSESA